MRMKMKVKKKKKKKKKGKKEEPSRNIFHTCNEVTAADPSATAPEVRVTPHRFVLCANQEILDFFALQMMCDTRATRVPESLGREIQRSIDAHCRFRKTKQNKKKRKKKGERRGRKERKNEKERKKEGINKENPTFQHVHPSTDVQIA